MTGERSRSTAPKGLGAAGRRFWRDVTGGFILDAGELALLRQACAVLDRIDQIRDALVDAPLMVAGSTGQLRANPLLSEEREAQRLLDTLVRSLALPVPGEQVGSRRDPQRSLAAKSRHRTAARLGLRKVD